MRQRYYNTEIKRFINQDIVVGSISNSQSLNRYSYVQGNPVTLTDPFGLSPSAKDIIMGAIHGILDVVGCSPELIGMGANLINAALYAFVDHDYGMAALSLLAGVTFGAAKVVAMGGKFAKAAKTVETVGRFVSNVASFAICTKQAVDVGSEMWQKYYVEGKSLDGDSMMEFLAFGLNVAGMAMSGKGMVESGNKICKSIKESGVTNKVSGKVKYWAKKARDSNGGFVDPNAPVIIGGSGNNFSVDSIYNAGKKAFDKFDINNAYVKPKHLSITGGKGQKFLATTKVEAENILKDVLINGEIVSISDNGLTKMGNSSYEIIINAGKTIGTKGESLLKIVISDDGGMLSAYPVL